MKRLLLISFVMIFAALSGRAQAGFDSSRLSSDGRKAYQALLAATQFTIGPAGYGGFSQEENALRTLLTESVAQEACANLVNNANYEGGLYGLLGLRILKSEMFPRQLKNYQLHPSPPERIVGGVKVPEGKLVTMSGCFILRVSLTELVSKLEAGAFDDEFVRDGRPLKIGDAQQLVGPERQERVSHQTWCGEG
jgi:hypothetical protein